MLQAFVLLHTQINKVFLGNDSHGRGRGIFVEEIEVQCAGEDPVIFPSRCWLAEDEGDGKTARVLVPGETIQPQLDSKKLVVSIAPIYNHWPLHCSDRTNLGTERSAYEWNGEHWGESTFCSRQYYTFLCE